MKLRHRDTVRQSIPLYEAMLISVKPVPRAGDRPRGVDWSTGVAPAKMSAIQAANDLAMMEVSCNVLIHSARLTISHGRCRCSKITCCHGTPLPPYTLRRWRNSLCRNHKPACRPLLLQYLPHDLLKCRWPRLHRLSLTARCRTTTIRPGRYRLYKRTLNHLVQAGCNSLILNYTRSLKFNSHPNSSSNNNHNHNRNPNNNSSSSSSSCSSSLDHRDD